MSLIDSRTPAMLMLPVCAPSALAALTCASFMLTIVVPARLFTSMFLMVTPSNVAFADSIFPAFAVAIVAVVVPLATFTRRSFA